MDMKYMYFMDMIEHNVFFDRLVERCSILGAMVDGRRNYCSGDITGFIQSNLFQHRAKKTRMHNHHLLR